MRTKLLIILFLLIAHTNIASAVVMPDASTPSFSEKIIGKWEDKESYLVVTLSGITEYLPDGTARMEATAEVFGKKFTIAVKGSWKIIGNQLIMKASESSHPKLMPPGEVTTDEIVSISTTEMILLGADGKRQISERVK